MLSPQLRRRGALAVVALAAVAVAALRLLEPALPGDLSAYAAAAETFAAGQSPYGEALSDARSWQGFPFLYLPATLPLLALLRRLPRRLLLLGDVAARFALAGWCAAALRRRLGPTALAGSEALLLLLLYEPFVTDLLAGNLATYMLGALVAALLLSERGATPQLGGGLLLGAVLMIKPPWLIPAAFIACQRRRPLLAAALLLGAGAALALSAATGLLGAWLARLIALRPLYRSFDLGSLCPPLLPVAAAAWLGVGVWLGLRRDARARRDGWLWGCASLWAWPRLGSYCYLALTPALLALGERHGWRALLLCLPALGPLPWSLDWYPYQGLLYGWSLVVSLALLLLLRRADEDPPRLPARAAP